MITALSNKSVVSTVAADNCIEYRGLSTDDKPTSFVPNGSVFLEMDTGKVYCYNADGSAWIEL